MSKNKCPNTHKTEGDNTVNRVVAAVVTAGLSEVAFAIGGYKPDTFKDTATDPHGNKGVGYGSSREEARRNADADLDARRSGIVRTRES